MQEWAIILPVLWFAAVVQGSTGFGFGLVAVGMMTFFLPIQNAAVMNALPALAVNFLLLWQLHPHLRWKDLRWIAPASMLATPIGVMGLRLLDLRVMNGILAAVLAAAILQSLCGRAGSRPWHALWLGVPMGLLSGLLAGAYGTGGPPFAAFVQSHRYGKHRHVASIQLLLAITGSIRVLSLVLQNALTPAQWRMNALGVFAVLPGVWAGLYLLRRLPEVWLRRAVLGLLVVSMMHCVLKTGIFLLPGQ